MIRVVCVCSNVYFGSVKGDRVVRVGECVGVCSNVLCILGV